MISAEQKKHIHYQHPFNHLCNQAEYAEVIVKLMNLIKNILHCANSAIKPRGVAVVGTMVAINYRNSKKHCDAVVVMVVV